MSELTEYTLEEIFPFSISGEWGYEPAGLANALALRAADFTKDCKFRQEIGVPRFIPKSILKRKSINSGDILIEKSGGSPDQPVGRVAYFDRHSSEIAYIHSNFLQLLRASDEFDKRFCYYLLSYLYNSGSVFRYQQQTTGIINLKLENYLKERVCVPNREVQKKIAHILKTIDQVIEKTETLIDKYQKIKAGLMHDLFTRGIGPDGQLRPPREQAPELYQETPIGWIPKEWQVCPLREVAHAGIPHIKTGPFGSSLKGEHWVRDGVPVITIGALGEGEFLEDELLFISEFYANFLSDYRMREGEVVFSRVADVGRSAVIESEQIGWVMSSNLMRINLDSKKANSHFLQYLLSFDSRVRKQIRCRVNSGGRDVANGEVLNSIIFIWPPINEQEHIVSRAAGLVRRISEERKLMKSLQKQKSGLMHDLLTGQVRVNPQIYAKGAVDVSARSNSQL